MISEKGHAIPVQPKNYISLRQLVRHFILVSLAVLFFSTSANGSFDCTAESPLPPDCIDTPTSWTNFSTAGYISPYTYLGQPISDYTQSSDPSNGGTAVEPDSIDLASGSPNSNPGPYDTPAYGYYDGGTPYDPSIPSTLEDDYILFRMRLYDDPSTDKKDDFQSRHWNILVDVDDDGYKEYWVDVNGSYSPSDPYDQLQILYNNDNNQEVTDPDADRVNEFLAYNSDSFTSSFTRTVSIAGSTDYFLEVQVPMTAFNDENGNQVLFPDDPVGFVFSTSSSNTDPLQKDWMMDLDFLSNADPITFGDVVTINGEPIIEFVDSSLEEISFYEEEENVYTYVKHPVANTDEFTIETISITVTNPTTDDDEELRLCESNPNSGLFTNQGGAEITSALDADGWISGVFTSSTNVIDPAYDYGYYWEARYDLANDFWRIYRSPDNIVWTQEPAQATTGVEYTSNLGEITFTVYQVSPADGDTISISTCAPDPLPWVEDDEEPHNKNDDGELEFSGGDTIQFSYTYDDPVDVDPSDGTDTKTLTTSTPIVGTGEPYIEFTRSSGLPNTDFELKQDYTLSDKIYVTVTHDPTLYTAGVVDTITVTLTGNDTETITLTETGTDTGIFRNTTGLDTQIDDGTGPIANRWEDVDSAEVTATYTYPAGPVPPGVNYTTTADLFYVNGAGRVNFTNSAGTEDVELYKDNQSVYIKVDDPDLAGDGTVDVVLTSLVDPIGMVYDSVTVTLTETAVDSGVFINNAPGDPSITTDTYDGAFDDTDNFIEIVHDTTFTVTYTDLDDGDSDPLNNPKTDTASYFDPPVVINEVFFYPTPDAPGTYDGQTEYFQIYNSSASDVDIYGYTITDGDGFTYTFPEMTGTNEFTLEPGEFAYVFLYGTFVNPPANYNTEISGVFYLFADVGTTTPSDEFGDPGYVDPDHSADQLTLKDALGVTQDYVAWSSVASPTIDFLSDDSAAVSQGIWEENNFRDVYTASISQGEAIKRSSNGFDTDDPSDWVYNTTTLWDTGSVLLTPVGISFFKAHVRKGRVILRWETTFEKGTVGFYIFRKNSRQFMYELVNKKLIPALIGNPQGGTYRYHDKTAVPGESYSYLIEEVVDTGERIEYGPYEVKPVKNNKGERFTSELSRTARKAPDFARKRHEFRKNNKAHQKRTSYRYPFFRKNANHTESLKITTSESGLYFLSFSEIALNFGIKQRTVRKFLNSYRMKLSSQGKKVPYIVDSKNRGIYFYGSEHQNIYTDKNVFWLSFNYGQRMQRVNLKRARKIVKDQSFNNTIHFEEESFPVYSQPWENLEDYWAWGYSFCGFEGLDLQTYNFHLNGVMPTTENATLTLNLIGGSIDGAGDDHLAEISLNGNRIGDCTWKGIEKIACELSFSQQILSEANNILEVKGVLIGDAGFSLFYVDSFDVNYQRYYRSVENSIQVSGDNNSTVSISGFDSNKIFLLDVTNPYKPIFVNRTKVRKRKGSYWLSFTPKSPTARYLALTPSALKQVDDITLVSQSGLRKRRNTADYLIITPTELKESVQELADYRSEQGYKVKIVELDQIINEFNDGIYSPIAIKKFLSYTHKNWRRSPQFVVLIGNTNYDYQDVEGYGGNIMPTIFLSSQNGLFPSDGYLADVNDDNIPDMAIGRLPVLTPEELQIIISKIKVFEYSSETWKKKMLLLADESDGNSIFAWDSEQISHLLPADYLQKKIYLTNYSLKAARQKLLDELDDGAAFVNYLGHGGPDRFANYGLLLSNDVSLLSTTGGAPIVTALTCAVGEFIFTNFDTLAELLLLQPNGGATAVWSASGLSENDRAKRLGNEFYYAIFNQGSTVLGEAILKSFQNYSRSIKDPYHILIYNLLGDPALKIR